MISLSPTPGVVVGDGRVIDPATRDNKLELLFRTNNFATSDCRHTAPRAKRTAGARRAIRRDLYHLDKGSCFAFSIAVLRSEHFERTGRLLCDRLGRRKRAGRISPPRLPLFELETCGKNFFVRYRAKCAEIPAKMLHVSRPLSSPIRFTQRRVPDRQTGLFCVRRYILCGRVHGHTRGLSLFNGPAGPR